MANSKKDASFYGQFVVLIIATMFALSISWSLPLVFILPFLGIWQLIEFLVLWSKNGYKKWYTQYICAVLLAVLLGIVVCVSLNSSEKLSLPIIFSCILYTIVVGWIYLLYWRKK